MLIKEIQKNKKIKFYKKKIKKEVEGPSLET